MPSSFLRRDKLCIAMNLTDFAFVDSVYNAYHSFARFDSALTVFIVVFERLQYIPLYFTL